MFEFWVELWPKNAKSKKKHTSVLHTHHFLHNITNNNNKQCSDCRKSCKCPHVSISIKWRPWDNEERSCRHCKNWSGRDKRNCSHSLWPHGSTSDRSRSWWWCNKSRNTIRRMDSQNNKQFRSQRYLTHNQRTKIRKKAEKKIRVLLFMSWTMSPPLAVCFAMQPFFSIKELLFFGLTLTIPSLQGLHEKIPKLRQKYNRKNA